MAKKKIGKQTIQFIDPPSIISTTSIVGPKEGKGPLSQYFDIILDDDLYGEDSWEKAESKMVKEAVKLAAMQKKLHLEDIDYLFAGDLLNQLMSSSFAARDLRIPYFGLFGACSTMAESLSLAAIMIEGGFADYVVATTSSHFSSAERQFRFPLELGNQRPLTSQWTVTGAGAAILAPTEEKGPYITRITTGRVIDYGIKDANNMGAAMAPAAVDTIKAYFQDTGESPNDFDLIVTGDLGRIGNEIAIDLLRKEGMPINKTLKDCGVEIFDHAKQDTHAGGSGCGCSAVVFCGYLYKLLKKDIFKKILLVSTGALLSPTSIQQGESIPSIAHAVAIEGQLKG
ncbi:stage V sporulation protein AD [Clostridium aceticum]|uniref:Stage V sporulation protein AD n=1 Tax=Clostridium aceticum TaxID=84022 RepID=A0A0D8IC86_9CLOT|nr:stage V sporulation protein AD [Clostridium aceticum]AKL94965.1 stage V sporulation protein AD [Clostridium aceticum]KJF27878.1 stage V sporulation protein AD [Clostridium aceticum]